MAPALVYFVDVGQGDCSLIVLPDGSGILVDCASELAATSLMQDRGVSHLRAIVVTHLDIDHIGGLRSLLTHYIERQAGREQAAGLEQIDSLWIAQDRTRGNLGCEARQLLALTVGAARGSGIAIRSPLRDDGEGPKIICQQPGMVVELLLPFCADQLSGYLGWQSDGNPSSAVVRVRVGDARLLVCGDALLRSLEELHKQAPEEVSASVVRTSHHGGDILAKPETWSDYNDLYSRMTPTLAVHTVGTGNRHGHPLPEHVAASASGKCHVMCTQLTARCHDDLDEARLKVSAFLEVAYPDYRLARRPGAHGARGVPCAGTVLVVLEDGEFEVYPPMDEHRSFVQTLSRPLCLAGTDPASSGPSK